MSWKHGTAVLAASTALVISLGPLGAAEPTGQSIMEKATNDHRAQDERAKADMVILAKGRRTKKRSVVLMSASGEDSNDKLLIRFESPADIRGTTLLTLERGEREDQHLYLPALRKTKRIASSGKGNRFAGTDFTYEDLRTEELSRNRYSLIRSEHADGKACWVVEATPANDWWRDESAYSRRLLWVRKDHHLVVRVEYFDKKDRKCKVRLNRGWTQTGGVWRFKDAEMQDLRRKSRTLLRVRKRAINPGLSSTLFSPDNLSRG